MTSTDSLDVVAIGEAQIRLSSGLGTPLRQATELRSDVAGTEGNVLGLLAQLGASCGLVTALPQGPLAERITATYTSVGLDLSRTVWRTDGRVALYFVDEGVPPVPSRVYYDRRDSCFSRLLPKDIDWDYVGASRLLHLSGVTAALGGGTRSLLTEAVRRASDAGRLRSVDVNHRSRLWQAEDAAQHLAPLLEGADVVFCSRRDAAAVFGIDGPPENVPSALAERFGARVVAVSDGARPVRVHTVDGALTATPPSTTIVDRVGAGDAFVGAFLHGVLADDVARGLELGVAAASLILTRRGDLLVTDERELDWLIACSSEAGSIER